jgi:nicotinamidase-related amidase
LGTPDVELVSELSAAEDDLILTKSTPSFFIGTPLEQFLHARGARTIVLCGVATELGIDLTARHASALGYLVVVAEDAVSSFTAESHAVGLERLRSVVEVLATDTIVSIWDAATGS